MKTIINLFIGVIFLINSSYAGDLNYKLNLANINFTSDKSMEFDIYLINTSEKDELRYSLGQYFLDFNLKIANSGLLTYSIVKSDLPESMKPGSVAVSGNQLRMSVNQINRESKNYPVIPSEKPGLLIARMKLETSAKEFSKEDLELKWSDAENNFKTKIVAFTNDKLVEITKSEDHFAESDKSEKGSKVVEKNTSLPTEFSLAQNYPNPFNPSTNLEFDISNLEFVSLKVYDVVGKEVAALVNENLSPGRYEVKFDGSNFGSGVYFYKITAGNFTAVKRMFLVK